RWIPKCTALISKTPRRRCRIPRRWAMRRGRTRAARSIERPLGRTRAAVSHGRIGSQQFLDERRRLRLVGGKLRAEPVAMGQEVVRNGGAAAVGQAFQPCLEQGRAAQGVVLGDDVAQLSLALVLDGLGL